MFLENLKIPLVISFVSHVWPNFVEPAHMKTSQNVLLVLLGLLLILITFANVSQDISNQMVLVKSVQLNVMDVKLMEFAVNVLIQSTENLIKIVTAQLDFMTMVHQFAKHAILFVKLVKTQPLVPHVSLKTIELWSTVNVFALQDSIKSSTLIILFLVENVVQNVKNVQDQLFVSTVMLPATESLPMMISEDKPVPALQDITP